VARHNEPEDAGWTGSGIWEPAIAIVTGGVIKVWYGIVRGDREYLRDDSRTLSSAEARGRFILDQDPAAAAQSDGPQLTATIQPPHELSR
jgi:hypothetical protein